MAPPNDAPRAATRAAAEGALTPVSKRTTIDAASNCCADGERRGGCSSGGGAGPVAVAASAMVVASVGVVDIAGGDSGDGDGAMDAGSARLAPAAASCAGGVTKVKSATDAPTETHTA